MKIYKLIWPFKSRRVALKCLCYLPWWLLNSHFVWCTVKF